MNVQDFIPQNIRRLDPRCSVFGVCGGCLFQDLDYADELAVKKSYLQALLGEVLDLESVHFHEPVASPKPYHSRSRLDLTMKRFRDGEIAMGFQPPGSKRLLAIEECAIADERISAFIPELRRAASEKLPAKYRTANLVIKTDDDRRVVWGGIGKGSLKMAPDEYLSTAIKGRRLYYSLDTFFQANLSILPALIERIESLMDPECRIFFDLYGGVGLFSFPLAARFEKVFLVEDNPASTRVAAFNAAKWQTDNIEIHSGKVEDLLAEVLGKGAAAPVCAMVDPPRQGLSDSARAMLREARGLRQLFYLSCHPESLARDLKDFVAGGWQVEEIIPFDFFPKTRHIETLVLLRAV